MTLRLYDSPQRQIRDFTPLQPGKVGIYVCGPTVQSSPHIGHLRSAVVFDVLARWLRRSGYEVRLIRNVTDIDDKILAKAAEAEVPWWAWAQRFEREFSDAYDVLGNEKPTYEPRATGHVPEMIALISRLIERGHAYQVGSDVYFDVRSFDSYGALTHQNIDDVEIPDDGNPRDKKDPRDFALWKGIQPGQNQHASWDTPFGRGRPGWHLECSAMAYKYLGESFDIHGGGLDLRFPHHENEQAQSRAAGYGFAQYWMHHGWVTQSGEKMSKSVGNTLALDALLQETSAAVLRYILVSAQYRSMLEFGDNTITDAEASWQRVSGFVERAEEKYDQSYELAKVELPEAFVTAMDEDLNVPAALAVIHETVRAGNTLLTAGDDAGTQVAQVRAMLDVLGLDPLSITWRSDSGDKYSAALDVLVQADLQERQAARAAKDFVRADAIRDKLSAAGIIVMDGADSQTWSISTNGR